MRICIQLLQSLGSHRLEQGKETSVEEAPHCFLSTKSWLYLCSAKIPNSISSVWFRKKNYTQICCTEFQTESTWGAANLKTKTTKKEHNCLSCSYWNFINQGRLNSYHSRRDWKLNTIPKAQHNFVPGHYHFSELILSPKNHLFSLWDGHSPLLHSCLGKGYLRFHHRSLLWVSYLGISCIQCNKLFRFLFFFFFLWIC